MSDSKLVRRLTAPLRLPEVLRALRADLDRHAADLRDAAVRLHALEAELADARARLRRRDDEVQEPYEELGVALQDRLDHALLHAEALDAQARDRTETELATLRSALRLTQAVAEQAAAAAPPADSPATAAEGDTGQAPAPAAPRRAFQHPTPSFELLYRSFEDAHRGTEEDIQERQRGDYLELVEDLPAPDLPVVDLGCGRGELVRLLQDAGIRALGVDANLGQLPEGAADSFVQADLFDWLDEQPDGSVRGLFVLHVIEHLPSDLQVRLVFEARRVLVDDGLLVVETPNALSLATAATNFWVDPTHIRPVHPLLLEFLAQEAGLRQVRLLPLHPVPLAFRGGDVVPELVEDLDQLIFGAGDIALTARR